MTYNTYTVTSLLKPWQIVVVIQETNEFSNTPTTHLLTIVSTRHHTLQIRLEQSYPARVGLSISVCAGLLTGGPVHLRRVRPGARGR